MEKHVVRLRLHGCVVCGVLRTTPTREAGRGSRAVVDKRHFGGCRLPTTHPLTVTFLLRC